MNILSAIYISVMAVCFSLAIVNLIIWFNLRKRYRYLLFALSAIAAGFMAALDGIGIRMEDPQKYLILIKYYHIPIFILLISIIWFIRVYFRTGRRWLAIFISIIWSVCMVINFSSPHGLTFLSIESMQTYSFFGKDTFNFPVATRNPFGLIADFASVLILIYMVDATINLYRKGIKERAILVGGGTILFMLLAGLITPLSDLHKVILPSMISILYMFIIFAMSLELVKDVIKLPELRDQLSARKKIWESLLNKVELIVIEVDKFGLVNYVNPFYLTISGFSKEEILHKDWMEMLVPTKEGEKIKEHFNIPLQNNFPTRFKSDIIVNGGRVLTVDWTNIGISDNSGEISGIISIGNDITKRERAFKEILSLKQQLEVENLVLKESLDDYLVSDESIVVKSAASKYAFEKARQVAEVETTVLLLGETGVGKGIYAKFIHDSSPRSSKTFLHVNCAAIPADLLESELFGYEKGAFTGATKQKKGRFELADKGTLFLDEIAEIPAALQPKLLRVLQSGEFERLGSEKTIRVNVRIIAATNRQLAEEVRKNNFREDLYYRLNVFPITIPPLRKRKEDIPELVNFFTYKFQKKYKKNITKVSKHTYLSFSEYDWPGNIRELQNIIERAVISSSSEVLKTNGLIEGKTSVSSTKEFPSANQDLIKLEDVERHHIESVMEQCNWRIHGQNGAAALLDINPSTLRSRMKKLKITSKRFSENID